MFTLFDVPKAPKTAKCLDCKNCLTCTHKLDKVYGKGEKGLVFILDRPTEQEDRENTPYNSARTRELAQSLGALGIDIHQDCYLMYAVACWSPQGDKTLKKKDLREAHKKFYPLTKLKNQINNCRQGLEKRLESIEYNVVCPLGKTSVKTLLDAKIIGRISSVPRKDYYGEHIPDQQLGKWVCPTYSVPEMFMGGNDYYMVANKQRQQQLQWVVENINTPVPTYPIKLDSTFETTLDHECAIEMIQDAMQHWKHVGFDYETTSIKAQPDYNNITCVSISNGQKTYGFPFYRTPEFLDAFEMLMIDPSKKIAHNAQFEHIWTRVKGGRDTIITSWHWDTMLGARMIHNQKSAQLKFQTYVNFGTIGYDDYADKYLISDKSSGNAKNDIELADINKIIEYCCLDSYYTMQLFFKQREHPYFKKPASHRAMQFALDGDTCLGDAHCEGLCIHTEELKGIIDALRTKGEQAKKDLLKQYPKWNGKTSGAEFGKFIYDYLGCRPKIYTKDDNGKNTTTYCTDKEALSKLSHSFIDAVKPISKINNQISSFLSPILAETYKDKVHAFIGLGKARTFRTASNSPNVQNIPKHDQETKQFVRGVIYPSKGNKLIEHDYKALEVSIAACVFQDPMLIKYVTDPTTDMHRDVAVDIFFRTKETFLKSERQAAKGGYVFPSFYGSSGYNCGDNMWETLQEHPETLEHLAKHGITSREKMQKHMQAYDKTFWGQRFAVYSAKKQELYKKYLKDGYIDLVTGFRCQGPMGWTQLINIPVQGPASHIKLWTMCEMIKRLRKENMKSKIVCEIHDAIIGDVVPEEEDYYDHLMIEYGTKAVREFWPWISVPLVLEKESTEIDCSWATMK